MNYFAALIYWVVVALWLTVLAAIAYFYARNPRAFGITRLLLAVLAIDTARNVLENIYFGLYFGGQYGLFPAAIAQYLGQPKLLIVPKLLNIAAGCVVLGLLLFRWLPLAVRERGRAEQRATDLETLAALDWLTGLYNRRHFESLAGAELARSQRYLRPLSVLMIDIDHFKEVNDHFGHPTGDRVIRAVANVLLATKREADLAARVGGEEFAVMLPETTEAAAVQMAERLREQLQLCPPIVSGEKFSITLSIGVAGATSETAGIDMLLACADHALYEAKNAGRDRVVAWRDQPLTMFVEAAA
ncbi:MAG TPA: GGDEF domain-containing protein [Xanthobacteraceae bacterium]|jgi:diguanylate cyclase (GGDEF)-like protein